MSSYRPSCSYPPPPLTASYVYVETKAQEILENPYIIRIANLVTNLYHGKETDESPSSKLLYESFTQHFPTLVVVNLLQVYRSDFVTSKIRSYSLTLLDSLLINLDYTRVELEKESYHEIKNHLDHCLAEEVISDHDFELLTKITTRVFFYFYVEYIAWDELCSYMISLDSITEALWIFNELPMVVNEEFLMRLLENGLQAGIVNGLLNPDSDLVWSLALDGGFNLMLQLVGKKKDGLITDLVYAIVKSVWEMANVRGREIIVRQGFIRIAKKVGLEAVRFREAEYEVVSKLALMLRKMNGIGEATEMAAKRIHEVLDKYYYKYKPLVPNPLVIHGS